MSEEFVLTVNNEIINSLYGESDKFIIKVNEDSFLDCINANKQFTKRCEAENDKSKKQIVSYCLIISKDSVFVTQRTRKQTEKRLHNKFSIGIGGHINPCDLDSDKLIEYGMLRELREEMKLPSNIKYKFLGIINDNSSDVNRVHTGVVYIVEVENYHCEINETDKMTGEWVSITKLNSYKDSFEKWSNILLSSLPC